MALTKQQEEFFKDSIARDSDGDLMVFYHGSHSKKEFDAFDNAHISGGTGCGTGYGFYFSPDKEFAEGYAHGNEVLEVYLNYKNPITEDTTVKLDDFISAVVDCDNRLGTNIAESPIFKQIENAGDDLQGMTFLQSVQYPVQNTEIEGLQAAFREYGQMYHDKKAGKNLLVDYAKIKKKRESTRDTIRTLNMSGKSKADAPVAPALFIPLQLLF